jgi:hypothetical protein
MINMAIGIHRPIKTVNPLKGCLGGFYGREFFVGIQSQEFTGCEIGNFAACGVSVHGAAS